MKNVDDSGVNFHSASGRDVLTVVCERVQKAADERRERTLCVVNDDKEPMAGLGFTHEADDDDDVDGRLVIDEDRDEEESIKDKCPTDRYDSSESSDSGVAALSSTDYSPSSGTSDITEPDSPDSPYSTGGAQSPSFSSSSGCESECANEDSATSTTTTVAVAATAASTTTAAAATSSPASTTALLKPSEMPPTTAKRDIGVPQDVDACLLPPPPPPAPHFLTPSLAAIKRPYASDSAFSAKKIKSISGEAGSSVVISVGSQASSPPEPPTAKPQAKITEYFKAQVKRLSCPKLVKKESNVIVKVESPACKRVGIDKYLIFNNNNNGGGVAVSSVNGDDKTGLFLTSTPKLLRDDEGKIDFEDLLPRSIITAKVEHPTVDIFRTLNSCSNSGGGVVGGSNASSNGVPSSTITSNSTSSSSSSNGGPASSSSKDLDNDAKVMVPPPPPLRFPPRFDCFSKKNKVNDDVRTGEVAADKQRNDGDNVVCKWVGCHVQLDCSGGGNVLEHIQSVHVDTQVDGENFVCLWEGCKVYAKTSCSRSWLERHVLTHGGSRPFKCIVEGCGQRFGSQTMLERHVNGHFNQGTGSTSSSGTKRNVDVTPNKLIRRNGKKLRYRKRPWTASITARKCDYFDAGVMERLQHQLIMMTQYQTQADILSANNTVTFHARITAQRTEKDGKVKQLLRWSPANILPDEWVLKSEVNLVRRVPLHCLNSLSSSSLRALLFGSDFKEGTSEKSLPTRHRRKNKPL